MYHFFQRLLEQKGIEIRPVRASECQQLQAVARRAYIETYPDYLKLLGNNDAVDAELDKLYGLETLQDWISNPNSICLGVFEQRNQTMVGYSLMYLQESTAILSKIYLLKMTQGQGLGRLLLEHQMSTLRRHPKIESLRLNVWEANEQAIRFYLKQGFQPTGQRILYAESTARGPCYDHVMIRYKNPSVAPAEEEYQMQCSSF